MLPNEVICLGDSLLFKPPLNKMVSYFHFKHCCSFSSDWPYVSICKYIYIGVSKSFHVLRNVSMYFASSSQEEKYSNEQLTCAAEILCFAPVI